MTLDCTVAVVLVAVVVTYSAPPDDLARCVDALRSGGAVDHVLVYDTGGSAVVATPTDDGPPVEVVRVANRGYGAAANAGFAGAEALGAVLETEAAGEQAVAVGNMDGVGFGAARGGDSPRGTLAPAFDIPRGVADHRLLAGRAGGCVDSHEFFFRHGEQAKRIVVAKVLFDGERKFADIVDGTDILRFDAGLVEFLFIERYIVIAVIYHFDQPGALNGSEIFARGGLNFGVEAIAHTSRLLHKNLIYPCCIPTQTL